MNEIWVFCYRKPRPGYRILGRFIERDALVLFRVKDKRDIGGDYITAAAEVIADWQRYFGTQRPCSGTELSAYLSGAHYDVDQTVEIA